MKTDETPNLDSSLVKGKPTWDQLDKMYHDAVNLIVELRERAEAAEGKSKLFGKAAMILLIGSCDCGTKTPEAKFHAPDCRYRAAREILDPGSHTEEDCFHALSKRIKELEGSLVELAESKNTAVNKWVGRLTEAEAELTTLRQKLGELRAIAEHERDASIEAREACGNDIEARRPHHARGQAFSEIVQFFERPDVKSALSSPPREGREEGQP